VKDVEQGVNRRKDLYNSVNLQAKLNRRDKQLKEVVGYIGEVEVSINQFVEEINADLVTVEENKDENKDMFSKMNGCKESCEKCTKLCQDLRNVS